MQIFGEHKNAAIKASILMSEIEANIDQFIILDKYCNNDLLEITSLIFSYEPKIHDAKSPHFISKKPLKDILSEESYGYLLQVANLLFRPNVYKVNGCFYYTKGLYLAQDYGFCLIDCLFSFYNNGGITTDFSILSPSELYSASELFIHKYDASSLSKEIKRIVCPSLKQMIENQIILK